MRRKNWQIKEIDPQTKQIAQRKEVSVFLAQALLNRGINQDEFDSFLNPGINYFHSPFLLPDIDKGANRIKEAVEKREKVLVFGDYDVDGIMSLAIFHEFSKKFSGIFSFYIPHRVKEGYGLNREAILMAQKEGVSLIIAFDCGTNSKEEIELAKMLSIDIVIIDHHHPKEGLTDSFAFINPKRKDSSYPFSDLSTAALSYKLLQVLTKNDCKDTLDLVALSLICDVVPLKGENRALLKEGLAVIRQSNRPSVKALCQIAGIKQENIDTFHIGYILGPRINASGRVAHAKESLELFLSEDKARVDELAVQLGEYNRLRRNIEAQILKEAEQKINDNIREENTIVVSGDKWHPGVLGIVASRLADKYYRPSFVFSFDEGLGVGSGRSIHSVHLMEVLDKCADSLIEYGGHSKAAGVQIEEQNLDNFKEKINSLIEENLSPQDFIPVLTIDAQLDFCDIDTTLALDLEKLKPHGEANREPLFMARNIFKKGDSKKISFGYSLWLSDGEKVFEGIVYDKDLLEIIEYCESFDIVFSLQMNTYHNIPKLIIRDCRFS